MPKCAARLLNMTKILSENEVKKITGVSKKQYKNVHWHTATIVVKQFISLSEYVDIVRKIISDCKTDDNNIATELIDFSIRVNIISSYSFVDLPKDIDELYYIVYASDLFDTVCSVANKEQVKTLISTVMSMVGIGVN